MLFGHAQPQQPPAPVQVAVIDDEEDICQCLRMALEQYQISSAEAHTGREGLELIRARKPQLILLDMKMPDKNGYQLLAELQRDAELNAIPVFVMTSLDEKSSKSDEEWARSLGVPRFFSKPFKPDQVALAAAQQLKAPIPAES